MSEDELMMRFELSRQSIAGWSAGAIEFVRAAAERQETGNAALGVALDAHRMLAAVREEAAFLSEASLALPTIGDEFKRGIATALEELSNLDRQISNAIARMQ